MSATTPIDVDADAPVEEVRAALAATGVALIAGDTRVAFAARAAALGTVEDHDGTGTYEWDIAVRASGRARSHGADHFSLHTDCSYQPVPPTHIAMHVVRADRLGGGVTRLVRAADVVAGLDAATVAVLSAPMPLVVPDEFAGAIGVGRIEAPVIEGDTVRYRQDLLAPDATDAQREATATFGRVAESIADCWAGTLAEGTTLLCDNRRWLHARSGIVDPARHLLRIRFSFR